MLDNPLPKPSTPSNTSNNSGPKPPSMSGTVFGGGKSLPKPGGMPQKPPPPAGTNGANLNMVKPPTTSPAPQVSPSSPGGNSSGASSLGVSDSGLSAPAGEVNLPTNLGSPPSVGSPSPSAPPPPSAKPPSPPPAPMGVPSAPPVAPPPPNMPQAPNSPQPPTSPLGPASPKPGVPPPPAGVRPMASGLPAGSAPGKPGSPQQVVQPAQQNSSDKKSLFSPLMGMFKKKNGEVANQGGQSSNSPAPTPAQAPKKSSSVVVIGGVVIIALVLIGLGGYYGWQFINGGGSSNSLSPGSSAGNNQAGGRQTVPSEKVTLTYWGLWESTNAFEEILSDFEEANPNIEVNYQNQNHPDFRERLQTAIASKNGPDLFRYHASWVPMLREELEPLPSSVMSVDEYKEAFYPIAVEQLQFNGQLVGIPLMYDGLALFYNQDILQAAGETPPQTWAELKTLATKLTVKTPDNRDVERGGLAIGNADNVEHFSDIIGLLMLQNKADPTKPTSKEAQEALQFYTNFVASNSVWSENLPNSTVAFARGDVAMIFAPSWRVHEIQAINPNLKFGIAPVPRLGSERIGWATYWAEGVNSKSDNTEEAWQLLEYLSSPEIMRKIYSSQSESRRFGELYSRKSLAPELINDELVAPFLEDAPYARNWYLNSKTFDNGINDQLIKYYEDAVTAILQGQSIDEVSPTLEQGTAQVLRQYGVPTTQ